MRINGISGYRQNVNFGQFEDNNVRPRLEEAIKNVDSMYQYIEIDSKKHDTIDYLENHSLFIFYSKGGSVSMKLNDELLANHPKKMGINSAIKFDDLKDNLTDPEKLEDVARTVYIADSKPKEYGASAEGHDPQEDIIDRATGVII